MVVPLAETNRGVRAGRWSLVAGMWSLKYLRVMLGKISKAQWYLRASRGVWAGVARYRLRIVEPPKVPVGKTPNSDKDGPALEPNLWMWVNPSIVYPPGKLEVPEPHKGEDLPGALPSPQPAPKEEDFASCSEATAVESLPPSSPSSEQSPPQKRFASSPSTWELTEEEEAEDQDDSSSVALPSPHKRAPLQSRRFRQASSQEGRLWSRPPLNYFHLIALALRNSAPCGLNVQQIYSFTRFEKVPASVQGGAGTRPRSCLWKLTEEGRRRFAEEARALASSRLESIQRCMSQPGVRPWHAWGRGAPPPPPS
ncbi:forkhead box protein R1 isoform X3 [Prionailurus viverrinus]|uniref:forkhead box protein R1 isoform X3 n=1 Tax=Prionailurus viverrinus TaxID=61388 RepID=UPI001FF4277F|nr:forkhead box protein R1 isoform X3 [Prionailurus viverrinus]